MKNKLYASGDEVRYKYYRNKISSPIRISKNNYYSDYFEANMSNIKKTWRGINELLFRRKKNLKTITAIKDPNNKNKPVKDSSHIPNIVNEHFALMQATPIWIKVYSLVVCLLTSKKLLIPLTIIFC